MTKRIIIDCDPGQDDAINLFLALAPETDLDIIAITTVAGNTSLEKTQRNARLLCELTGRTDIPIYAGCDAPLKLPLATAEEVHGSEGLEGIPIYEPDMPLQPQNAVDYLIETLLATKAPLTLVVTGPLTNIAKALEICPKIKEGIKDIIIMGGAMREGGNITPSAEFNIYVDPHAADIVFNSACELIIFGLDVTHKVLSSAEVLADMLALENPVATACHNLLTHYGRFEESKFGKNAAPLHDPCTIAYLLEPELFTLKSCNIRVECSSDLTRGHTAVDYWNGTDLPHNCKWAYIVDRDGFFEVLLGQLAKYPN